jgi:UDP-2,3-diacylglucosamine pyrophosphatase LpxH
MTGHIHREAAAEQASPSQYLVGADYQPPEDSASVTKLFG